MGNYLADRRNELNLTQKEVAEIVGVTEATVSRWESGAIANMRRDKIYLLAEALKTTTSFIMTGEKEIDKPHKQKSEFNLCECVTRNQQQYKSSEKYNQNIRFQKQGTEKTRKELFSYLNAKVFQYDDDIIDKMVTIDIGVGTDFRVPESLMEDRCDIASHLIDIISYMPEDTNRNKRTKLSILIRFLNEEGVDKVLSYVEGLIDNPKYHAEVEPIEPLINR